MRELVGTRHLRADSIRRLLRRLQDAVHRAFTPVPRSESVNLLEPQPTEGFSLSGPYRLPVAYSFVAERVFTLHNYRQPFRLLFLSELVILGVAHLLASLVFLVLPGLTAWLLSWLHFAFLIGLGGAQWWGLGVIVANRLPSHRSATSRGRA